MIVDCYMFGVAVSGLQRIKKGDDLNVAIASRATNRGTMLAIVLALGWIALILIVAVVQSTTYSGFVGALNEWQFDHMGHSFPAMTFLLLIALFAAPGLLLLGYAIKRMNATYALSADEIVIQRSRRMLWVLTAVAGLLVIATIVMLIQLAMLPGDTNRPERIEMGVSKGSVLPEGAIRLVGRYRYDRTATFRQSVLVTQRDYRFVPVQAVGSRPSSVIDVFAETSGSPDKRVDASEEHAGVLRRGGLPPAVERLYRDAGFRVSPSAYLLYPDRASMTWSYLAAIAQLIIVIVLLSVGALFTRRRLRLLRAGTTQQTILPPV